MSSRIGNFAKHKLIGAGLYRPARKLVDFIDRSRAHGKKKRKAFYSSFVGKGDLVFDAGANIGDYAETFLSIGARVVAIEPQASCVKELRARFKGQNIAIEFMAVGEHDGVGELFLRKHTWAAGLIQQWDEENTGSVKVPITTFDALIRKHGIPDYIKMDIEGYELPAIKGLTSAVKLISFEFRLSRSDLADRMLILEHLRGHGAKEAAVLADGSESWTVPWTSLPEFLHIFPDRLPQDAFFGDVFVRT